MRSAWRGRVACGRRGVAWRVWRVVGVACVLPRRGRVACESHAECGSLSPSVGSSCRGPVSRRVRARVYAAMWCGGVRCSGRLPSAVLCMLHSIGDLSRARGGDAPGRRESARGVSDCRCRSAEISTGLRAQGWGRVGRWTWGAAEAVARRRDGIRPVVARSYFVVSLVSYAPRAPQPACLASPAPRPVSDIGYLSTRRPRPERARDM